MINSQNNVLLTLLHNLQSREGYLPPSQLGDLAERLEMSLADLRAVASFYSDFRFEPEGRWKIKVCHGTACHARGAQRITDSLEKHLNVKDGETTKDGMFTVEKVGCLGCCSMAPVVVAGDRFKGRFLLEDTEQFIEKLRHEPEVVQGKLRTLEVRLGLGSCGLAAGAKDTGAALRKAALDLEMEIDVVPVGCLGMCYLEPLVEVHTPDGVYLHGPVRAEDAEKLLAEYAQGRPHEETLVRQTARDAFFGGQKKIALRGCGVVNPEDIEDALQAGAWSSLRRILNANRSAISIIETIRKSGLRGRGGGGFPTGDKWRSVALAPGKDKHIIVNADEGDPGAFMDRAILEGNPQGVLEGVAISAYAVGASQAWIYCRSEYPLALKRLRIAIEQANAHGWLGESVAGHKGFDLEIRIVEGAGAFICGEETALIESIEGRRAEPRQRPPYPATRGLFNQPTLVNNVETFADIPWILQAGDKAYRALGVEGAAGTKVFALVGAVKRTGLVEVPMGTRISSLLYGIGGGPGGDRPLRAVQIGGPSGGCIPADRFDLPIDYESLAAVGAMMGSGGIVALDESNCMVETARYFAQFTRDESCGRCTLCRVGISRIHEILKAITEGRGKMGDLDELEILSRKVKNGALCGLGRTAPNPILSTLAHFRDEYVEHIEAGRCAAGVCRMLVKYKVVEDRCPGCGICLESCPAGAILGRPNTAHFIDERACDGCGACKERCPHEAVVRR